MVSSKPPFTSEKPLSEQKPHTLHGDPEHDALRMTIPLIFMLLLAALYWLTLQVMPRLFGGDAGQFYILAVCAALPLALLGMKGLDGWLKKWWHSGRALHIEPDPHTNAWRIRYEQKNATEEPSYFPLQDDLDTTRWHFRMEPFPRTGRERQIPNGWYCAAVQMQTEHGRVVAHTFLKPAQAENLFARASFHQIKMGNLYEMGIGGRMRQFASPNGRPEIPGQLIIGEEGRYWLAERHRWQEGLELTPNDFVTLIETLKRQKAIP